MIGTILLLFLFVVSVFLLLVIASAFLGFVVTSVPFVPTPNKHLHESFAGLNLNVNDVVYDLGSGNGEVVLFLAKNTPARAVGFESTSWTHLWARLRKRFSRQDMSRAEFVRGNFFKSPWSEATVIYCYLYPHLMESIAKKAQAECKPGTRIISRDFGILSLEPQRTLSLPGHKVYFYQI